EIERIILCEKLNWRSYSKRSCRFWAFLFCWAAIFSSNCVSRSFFLDICCCFFYSLSFCFMVHVLPHFIHRTDLALLCLTFEHCFFRFSSRVPCPHFTKVMCHMVTHGLCRLLFRFWVNNNMDRVSIDIWYI